MTNIDLNSGFANGLSICNRDEVSSSRRKSTEYESVRDELIELYTEFAPQKLKNVDKMLLKYAGQEKQMLQAARAKYSGNKKNSKENARPKTKDTRPETDSSPPLSSPRRRVRRSSIGTVDSHSSAGSMGEDTGRASSGSNKRVSRRGSIGARGSEHSPRNSGKGERSRRRTSIGASSGNQRPSSQRRVPNPEASDAAEEFEDYTVEMKDETLERPRSMRARRRESMSSTNSRGSISSTNSRGLDNSTHSRTERRGSVARRNSLGELTEEKQTRKPIRRGSVSCTKENWDLKVGTLDNPNAMQKVSLRF